MRISTAGVHSSALTAILRQQSALAKTQAQLSSGKRILEATDDPLGSARLQRLDRTDSRLTQFTANGNAATTRLNIEEQALSDSYNVLQRVRELALQASNVTATASDRKDMASELSALIDQLKDVANRQDASGEYIFAGYATGTKPFATGSGGTTYVGDAGGRTLQIDDSNYVAVGDSGDAVFMDITQGNGTFTTAATSTNTGSGVIDTGSITSKSAWVSDDYTITFSTDPTTSDTIWTVTDSGGNTVSTGNYTSGDAITFNGAQVSITGTPVAGDTFSIAPAGKEDVFTTLQNMLITLQSDDDTDSGRALLGSKLNTALTQLDQAMTHIGSVRSTVGTRLNLIDTTHSSQSNRSLDLQTEISAIRDVDYTTAASALSQQYVGLQAAQQSYASISKLSLFNYL
ncbi:MAG: flagellar hook-associated protein FlgL [Steroidobacteraceae bacterium]